MKKYEVKQKPKEWVYVKIVHPGNKMRFTVAGLEIDPGRFGEAHLRDEILNYCKKHGHELLKDIGHENLEFELCDIPEIFLHLKLQGCKADPNELNALIEKLTYMTDMLKKQINRNT
jgi:hypothetical protein